MKPSNKQAEEPQNKTQYQPSQSDELFGLVKDTETNKVRIVLGKYLASQKEFDTFEDADRYIATKPYELMFNMIFIAKYYERDSSVNKEN